MKRARPTTALGGTPRKDHLFEDSRALCGGWMYGGGREVDLEDNQQVTELAQAVDEGEVCTRCARKAGVVS